MKSVFEFNLPDESEEFDLARNGGKYLAALQDLDNKLRAIVKYGGEEYTEEQIELYDKFRDMLREAANDNGVSIWE